MEEKILSFPKQFEYVPDLVNEWAVGDRRAAILAGMGGSHLAAGLMKIAYPDCDIVIHNDYGLPGLRGDDYHWRLFIASSYSGNTEETIDALETALARGLRGAVITTGGKLLDIAKERQLPHIVLPSIGVQPRFALGHQTLALARMLGREDALASLRALEHELAADRFEDSAVALVKAIDGKIPVIYASRRNAYLSYIWKIKINEGAKIPAFSNVLPEANHNDMNGFDAIASTQGMIDRHAAIFLRDEADDQRIHRRMDVMAGLFEKRGMVTADVLLEGASAWQRIFNAALLADWIALGLAVTYGTEPEQVPMIESFKKMLKAEKTEKEEKPETQPVQMQIDKH